MEQNVHLTMYGVQAINEVWLKEGLKHVNVELNLRRLLSEGGVRR
ncbi:hypothetical protein [Halalkalibacter alkaliphilus]|nr:hypothetical protein [Halalkalibacter alkaliphilus]